MGQHVGALPRPMIRNKHRVRADVLHHARLKSDLAIARGYRDPVALRDFVLLARRGWISTRGSGYCRPVRRCGASAYPRGTG